MKSVCVEKPFPHTELRTERKHGEDADKLVDDLLNGLAWAFVEPDKWRWAFRGARRCKYRVESSLDRGLRDRTKFGSDAVRGKNAEDYLLSQFKRAAQHYFPDASMPRDRSRLEWLALMQHYGTPTRLLDFTRSPYVACFFAIEAPDERERGEGKKRKTEACAVWAVDTAWLIQNSVCRIVKDLPKCCENDLLDCEYLAQNFEILFVNGHHLVLPVRRPDQTHGSGHNRDFFSAQASLKPVLKRTLRRTSATQRTWPITCSRSYLNRAVRTALLSELRLMNISRATLFPDLSGYAESLAHELEYRSADEIRRSR